MESRKRKLGQRVSPMSTETILYCVRKIRELLKLSATKNINIPWVVEYLISMDAVEIVDDYILANEEGLTFPDDKKILLRNSVYESACDGDGRSRFTIAHEIGHLFLHQNQTAYARSNSPHPIYQDSEWQADVFSSFFLVDPKFVHPSMTASDIAREFDITITAAKVWVSKYAKFIPNRESR